MISKRNAWQTILAVSVLAASGTQVHGERLTLATNGHAAATIVIAARPSQSAAFGALELREHIRKLSGATLPIVPDTAPVQGLRILIGESAATKALGLKNEDFQSQEYLIDVRKGALILMGRDAARPFGLNCMEGAPQWCEGRFGKALAFDGVKAHDRLVDEVPRVSDAQGSLSAWVKLEAGAWGDIVRLEAYQAPSYKGIMAAGQGILAYSSSTDGKTETTIKSEPLAPGWHHTLATWNEADKRMEFFVDGKSVGVAVYMPTQFANARPMLGIAGQATWNNRNFKGAIDEVVLTRAVMTPDGWDTRAPVPTPDTLALLHFDEGSGQPAAAILESASPNEEGFRPGWYNDCASCFAVYEFLEKSCGMRWYAPTELGTIYDRQPTLSVRVKECRRKPAFPCRQILGYQPTSNNDPFLVLNRPTVGEWNLWMFRLKMGGTVFTTASHGLYGYYDRFWEKNPNNPGAFEGKHPEFFAKGYEGKPSQLCYTSTDTVAQVARDIRVYLDTGRNFCNFLHVGTNWVSVEPMDSDAFCKCPQCMKWYTKGSPDDHDPAAIAADVFMGGKYSDYVFQFANAVQKEVSKTNPNGHVAVLAYARHAMPPSFPVDPKIYVGPCLATRSWLSPADPKAFKTWIAKEATNPLSEVFSYRGWADEKKESGRLLSMWLYHCFPLEIGGTLGFRAFPGYHAHTLANQMQLFAKDGIDGIFTCGSGEQIDAYVTMKYLDDPNREIDPLLDEFFARYYGPAGKPLKQIYTLIEETYGNPANWPECKGRWRSHETEEIAWKYLGTQKRMDTMAALMEQARTAKLSDVERQRVDLFDKGPWQYMIEGRKQWLNKSQHVDEVEALKRAPPPTAQAPAIPDAGGGLAKVDWSKAGHFAVMRTHEGYPSERRIAMDIAHDATYLYLRLSDPVAQDRVKSDGGVFDGDRWEIIVAAQCGAPEFVQFGIKSDGRSLCYVHPGCAAIESGAKVKCQVNDQGWVTELAAPLSLVRGFPQGAADTVYLNLYRPASNGQTTLAWSPNFAGNAYNSSARLGAVVLDK